LVRNEYLIGVKMLFLDISFGKGNGAPMLNWNAGRVKGLTGWEIWLFIIARVLIGFGIGVLCVRYFPDISNSLGFPALVIGIILLLVASKGLLRKTTS
jgi:hypothetical protein